MDIDEIRMAVARGWCSPENSHKEMDSILALAISDEVFKLLEAAPTPPVKQEQEQVTSNPLSEYSLEQWWVTELQNIWNGEGVITDEMRRAARTALNFAAIALSHPPADAQQQEIERLKAENAQLKVKHSVACDTVATMKADREMRHQNCVSAEQYIAATTESANEFNAHHEAMLQRVVELEAELEVRKDCYDHLLDTANQLSASRDELEAQLSEIGKAVDGVKSTHYEQLAKAVVEIKAILTTQGGRG